MLKNGDIAVFNKGRELVLDYNVGRTVGEGFDERIVDTKEVISLLKRGVGSDKEDFFVKEFLQDGAKKPENAN